MIDESTKEFFDFQYDYDVPNNKYGIVALGGALNNQNLITAYSKWYFSMVQPGWKIFIGGRQIHVVF